MTPPRPLALVTDPAPLKGLASWTVETVQDRASVADAALSPDEATLATGGFDGAIRLWNVQDGKLRQILVGHNTPVNSLAWSPDGDYLASAGRKKWNPEETGEPDLRIWQLGDAPRLIRRLQRAADRLAWSPDGKLLAFDSNGPQLYDCVSNTALPNFGLSGRISRRPWSSDGKLLATSDGEGVHIWDMSQHTLIHSVSGEGLSDPMWSSSGMYLAFLRAPFPSQHASSLRGPSRVEIWDMQSFQQVKTLPISDQADLKNVPSFSWSPTGAHVVTRRRIDDRGRETVVELWDVQTGNRQRPPLLRRDVSGNWLMPSAGTRFQWASSGRFLATVFRGKAYLTDLQSGQTRPLTGIVDPTYVHSSLLARKCLITRAMNPGASAGTIVWDLDSLQPLTTIETQPTKQFSIAIRPQADMVATVHRTDMQQEGDDADGEYPGEESVLRLWSIPGGALRGTLRLADLSQFVILWAPDGRKLALVDSRRPYAYVVDAEKVRVIKQLRGRGSLRQSHWPIAHWPIAWSPNGQQLAWMNESKATITNAATGETIDELTAPEREAPTRSSRRLPPSFGAEGLSAIVWSQDSETLAAAWYVRELRSTPTPNNRTVRVENNLRIQVWTRSGDSFKADRSLSVPVPTDSPRYRAVHLAFAPDPRHLAWAFERSLGCLDTETGHPAASPPPELLPSAASYDDLGSVQWVDDQRVFYRTRNSYGIWNTASPDDSQFHSLSSPCFFVLSGSTILVSSGSRIIFRDLDGALRSSLLVLFGERSTQTVAISPDGHFKTHSSPATTLVYVAQTTDGTQITLTPAEFCKRYGWSNDPAKVTLLP